MKLKVVAGTLIAANFTFTSLAHAQWGYGGYGGNVPCTQTPAAGATSDLDGLGDLLLQQKSLKDEKREITNEIEHGLDGDKSLTRRIQEAKEKLESVFDPHWAQVIEGHIERRMNCGICGDHDHDRGSDEGNEHATAPHQDTSTPASNSQGDTTVTDAPPAGVPPKVHVKRPGDDDGNPADSIGDQLKACHENHPEYFDHPSKGWKAHAADTADNRAWKVWACAHNGASTYEPSADRKIASVDEAPVKQSRMPASNSRGGWTEEHGSGGGVSSTSDVGNRRSDDDDDSWMKPSGGSAHGRGGGHGSPVKCYNRKDDHGVYATPMWQDICMEDGHINPDVCAGREANYFQGGHVDYNECSNALERYYQLERTLEKKQARLREIDSELDDYGDQISDLKNERRHHSSEDDEAMEAAATKGSKSGSSARSGPSFGQMAALGIGSTVLGGLGGYFLGHAEDSANRKAWNQNNAALTSLGWQTLPYQSQGYGLQGAVLGAQGGMSLFSSIAGGMNGAYGCGSMYGGVNPSLFGNPYMMNNPLAMMGGGMYNQCGSWGCAGPWGNNGLMAGGGFVGMMTGGMQGMYLGGMSGMYPGGMSGMYPGSFASASLMTGMYPGGMQGFYPGGMASMYPGGMQGFYPGGMASMYPGSFASASLMTGMYPGGMTGMYPGGFASSMYPGGFASAGLFQGGGFNGLMYQGGFPGSYGGYGSMTANAYQLALESQTRSAAFSQGSMAQYQQLQGQLGGIYSQMQMLQGSLYSNPYMYGGAGLNANIYGISPYMISPSIYSTGVLNSSPTIVPTTVVPGQAR